MRDDVRTALNTLLYHTTCPLDDEADFPLYDLLLVDCIVSAPGFPQTSHSKHMALEELLTATMTEGYNQHRRMCDLPYAAVTANVAMVREYIQQEVNTGNVELLCWSWLYHRYVRVDLAVNPTAFAGWIGVDERTLRRYTTHGIRRLTERLLRRERTLRQQKKRLWLYTRLTVPVQMTLIGRNGLMQQLQRIHEQSHPKHIQVTGEAGVGKTTLVHEFVRCQIDGDRVDHVIWVDVALSVHGIRKVIEVQCGTNLREWLAQHRTVIVLDAAEHLDENGLDRLLAELAGATVLLIRRNYRPLVHSTAHMCVPPLDEAAAQAYMRYIAGTRPLDEMPFDDLCTQAGGNPGRMRALLNSL